MTHGTPLVAIDDTVQRATAEQQQAQAEAAQALLDELHAQPRKETLEVARAQVELATASLKSAQDSSTSSSAPTSSTPESVSKDALDNAINAVKVAKANLDVVTRQYELTKAGAWVYDIQNQERQHEALAKASPASSALLAKYTIKAPADGVVLSIQAAVGSYVSPQGAYDTYTQGFVPVMVMGTANGAPRRALLRRRDPDPAPAARGRCIQAQMFIRGTDTSIPLEFVRVQPYVSPKIELSNQRLEKVDLRVLPVIFRFEPPPGVVRLSRRAGGRLHRREIDMRRLLAAAALGLGLGGCAVGPDFVRPDAPSVNRYTAEPAPRSTVAAAGRTQTFTEGERIAADWWRLFGSTKLDAIVAQSLADNPTLQAAEASLRRSQDGLRAGYGVFFPSVGVDAGASRERSNPAALGSSQPASVFNLLTLSASVSYTLDLWGGNRRALEGLGAQVDADRASVHGTYVMLSGNAVNTVVAQAAYRAQIQATRDFIAFEKQQIHVTEAQVQAGTVPQANVLSLRSQLASTEATLPPLQLKVDQAEHLLAVLAGRTPAEYAPVWVELAEISLPADVPVSLPSDLVRQRPDILLAEAQLHAAGAQVGVATAAMLPNLTLSAAYGSAANAPGTMFSAGSALWNVGAGITAPIFNGGTQWYQRKAAIDGHEQARALYRQAVLAAFQQVADTLRALEHDAEALRAQQEAVDTADEALKLVQFNYRGGDRHVPSGAGGGRAVPPGQAGVHPGGGPAAPGYGGPLRGAGGRVVECGGAGEVEATAGLWCGSRDA